MCCGGCVGMMDGRIPRACRLVLTPLSRSPLRQTARIQQRGFLDCSTPSPRTTTLARCTRGGWIACLSVVGEVMMKFAVWQEPAKQREDRGQRHFSQSCLARGRPGCWMPKHSKLKSPPLCTLWITAAERIYTHVSMPSMCVCMLSVKMK